MVLNILVIVIASLLAIIYAYVRKSYTYWSSQNILQDEPTFPLGNLQGITTTRHPADITRELYNKYVGKAPFVGAYFFLSPVVLVLDPELIKNILVRDFNYFHDRGFYYNEKEDPLSAHLFSLEGTKWKNLRAKLTPTFTSGKMKTMFDAVATTAEKMADHMREMANLKAIIDIKDIVSRYSIDVIGTCAFGIECNTLKNPDADFRVYGRRVMEPPKFQQIRVAFENAYPSLSRFLGLRMFDRSATDFFYKATESAVKYRQDNGVERKDFLQLLINLERQSSNANGDQLSMNEIAAQAFLFFLAGYETSSMTMTFCLYEMALNQEVQNMAREEILKVVQNNGGKMTYETMLQLPYLDKCVNETLRKYSAVDNLFRITIRDYKVPGTDHTIKKGTRIAIPIYGIQRDSRIYPNPEVFDPERFNEENITKRHPFTYLPFGEGPRVCIGLRFGMMQTRIGLASILTNYRLRPYDGTPKFITLSVATPLLAPDKPIKLQIENL